MRDQDHADHRHPFAERRRWRASAASPVRPPAIDAATAAAAAMPPRLQIRLVISKSGLLLRRAKAMCRSRRVRNRGRTGGQHGDSLRTRIALYEPSVITLDQRPARRRSAAAGSRELRVVAKRPMLFGDQRRKSAVVVLRAGRRERAAPGAISPPRRPRTARSRSAARQSRELSRSGAAAGARSGPPAPDPRSAPPAPRQARPIAGCRARAPRKARRSSPARAPAARRRAAAARSDRRRRDALRRQSAAAPDRICRNPTGRAAGPPARRSRRRSRAAGAALRVIGRCAGRRIRKRAPPTRPAASWRFSAQIRPRCASTICFEIDRPRPECVPNFSPAGRSL